MLVTLSATSAASAKAGASSTTDASTCAADTSQRSARAVTQEFPQTGDYADLILALGECVPVLTPCSPTMDCILDTGMCGRMQLVYHQCGLT